MTIEKIKTIAKEKYGMDMTDDMAAKYMEKYADKLGKLSDNELDNVSGGGVGLCDQESYSGKYCEPCGVWCDSSVNHEHGCHFTCPVCGTIYS